MAEPRIAEVVSAEMNSEWGPGNFQVDGKPFPWWISDKGPTATKMADDLYAVHVFIYIIGLQANGAELPETFHHEGLSVDWSYPVIQGVTFPWCITGDGFTYRSQGCSDLPTLELAFYAKRVEGCIPVVDATAADKVHDAQGYVVARPKELTGGN